MSMRKRATIGVFRAISAEGVISLKPDIVISTAQIGPDGVADQIGTIRGYYQFTGRDLTPQAEAAMRGYLADNKGDRHGKFEYSTRLLTDAGFDIDALNEEFAPFRERYGVEIEVRK